MSGEWSLLVERVFREAHDCTGPDDPLQMLPFIEISGKDEVWQPIL